MRRSVLNALATVSIAALVGVATSSQAGTPASLGTLKQIDKWKVGIVDPEGQSFCAMVNKFDHNVGLAFALSPEGYGSVAVDVATASFTPGEVYQVTLSTGGETAGTFPARATSARSVVVQVGQNTKFYDALKTNAPLGVGLPQFDAQFTLGKFAASYRQLVDCSQTLTGVRGNDGRMPAVKVKEVEKAALAPLDRELADISGDSAQMAEAPAANDKDAAFDDAGATLDKATEKAKTSLAALAEIGDQKQKTETVAAAPEVQKPARVLLASAKAPAANVPPATDSGATAKLWDETQETNAQKQAELDRAQEEADARFALLAAAKEKAAAQKPAFVTKTATVQITEPAKIVSKPAIVADDSALKAALAAKQAEIARVNAENAKQAEIAHINAENAKHAQELANKAALAARQAEIARVNAENAKQAEIARVNAESAKHAQELNNKLAATQSNYQSQISAVAAERDALKKQLADAKSEAEFSKARAGLLQSQIAVAAKQGQKASTDAAKLESLQTQLQKSEEQRQAMESQLAAVSKQTKLLAATLSQKQQQLESTSASAREIAAAKAEADRLQAENATAVEGLKRQLASQRSEFANLQTEYDHLQQQNQTIVASANIGIAKTKSELSSQLSRKEAYVTGLEQKLAALETERNAAAAKAEKAQADLAAASTAVKKHDELSTQLSRKDAYTSQLEQKLAALEAERTAATARAAKAQADLAAARKDSSSARKSLIIINDDELPLSLTHKQVPAVAENVPVAAPKASSPNGKSLVIIHDGEEQKSQGELTAQEKTATAETAKVAAIEPAAGSPIAGEQQKDVNDQRAKLAAAQAEIDRLRKGNEELATKLLLAADPDMPHAKGSVEEEQALNDQRAKLEAAQSEINRLKQGNEKLSTKLAGDAQTPGTVSVENTQTPDPVVTAELASTRSRVADLERQLQAAHDAQVAQKQLPAPIGRPSFVPVQTASVDSEDLSPVVSSPRPTRKPGTHVHVAKAEADIDVTREIQDMEPAAGDDTSAPALKGNWVEPAGAIRPAPHAPVRQVQQQVVSTPQAPVYGAKINPVLRGQPEPVDNDPGFNANRAEAFLDRIMSYHRSGVKKSPAVVEDVAEDNSTPVFQVTRRHAVARRPVVAAVAQQPEQGLSQIETAAGPVPQQQPAAPHGYAGVKRAVQQPVEQQVVADDGGQEFPAPVTAIPLHEEATAPVFSPAPVKAQAPVTVTAHARSNPSGVAAILAEAGISDASPSAPETDADGVTVQQWTTQGISGMFETAPAHGDFVANVNNYINRYREDCPALHVGMGAPRQSAAGKVEQADISCPTAGNTYSTSFVFWQDRKNFNAVLHSGYPTDASKVSALGGSISEALGGAVGTPVGKDVGTLSPQQDLKQADAAVEQYADRPQHHFNIPQTPSASYTTGSSFGQRPAFAPPANAPHGGDFDTVVIE